MLIYADSGVADEICKMRQIVSISGITTNPKLATIEAAVDLATKFNLPTSIQVNTQDQDHAHRIAHDLAKQSPNHIIKIPISDLELGKLIIQAGCKVNFTLCMSFAQAIAAINVGAHIVSVFIGRLIDNDINATKVIQQIRKYIDSNKYSTLILAASIRNHEHLEIAADSGSDIITIPPKYIRQVLDLHNSITIAGNQDFQLAYELSRQN